MTTQQGVGCGLLGVGFFMFWKGRGRGVFLAGMLTMAAAAVVMYTGKPKPSAIAPAASTAGTN